MKKKLLIVPFILGFILFTGSKISTAQANIQLPEIKIYTNQTFDVKIPFDWVRKTLPEDGKAFTTWQGKKAIEPLETIPFFRDELAEAAYGKTLKGKVIHRHLEEWMKPGIYIKNNQLHARGGWRLHKHSLLLPDFHDGTYEADIKATVINKKIVVQVYNPHFAYNSKTLSGKLGKPFLALFEKQMGNQISKMVEDAFSKALSQSMQDAKNLMHFVEITEIRIMGQFIIIGGKLGWL